MHDVIQVACEIEQLLEQNVTETRVWDDALDGVPEHIRRTAFLIAVRRAAPVTLAAFVETAVHPPACPAKLWLELEGVEYDERTQTAVFASPASLYTFKRRYPAWTVGLRRV